MIPDDPSAPLDPTPESLSQCPTLLHFFAEFAERLRALEPVEELARGPALDHFRQIELNKLHNTVTAANLSGLISDKQGAELQQLIQRRRSHRTGG